MNYNEALAYIENIQAKLGSDYSLRDVKELAKRMGHPERDLKVVHIAGTNGKGSVGNYISNILAASGYKVGRFISPAVFEYREKIQKLLPPQKINGAAEVLYVSEKEAAEQITQLKKVCEQMVLDGFGQPTAFEIETVMAFLLFRAWNVDVCVVECGLGGRLDATNILDNPLLCVFTSISMDHMKQLGSSITEIAMEKYGIIQNGTTVVAKYRKECQELLEKICHEKKAELVLMEEQHLHQRSISMEKTVFSYKGKAYTLRQGGIFQMENAALALEAVRKLQTAGFTRITEQTVTAGLFASRWRGRFVLLSDSPFLLVDGAHNEDAAKRLKESLKAYFPNETFTFVMGMFRDKEYEKVLEQLLPLANELYTVTTSGERGLSDTELALCAGNKTRIPVYSGQTIENVLTELFETAGDKKTVVCGSLSILKDVYRFAIKADISTFDRQD